MEQHSVETLTATREELRSQLRDLRAQRERDDQEGAQLERVLADIAATRRDRDAEMSTELEQARQIIEQGLGEVEDAAVAMSRVWTRVQVAGLGESDPRMRAATRVVDRRRRCQSDAGSPEHGGT